MLASERIMNCAPVVLFVYNRVDHTSKTIKALLGNFLSERTDLIVYSDAASVDAAKVQVKQVRDYLRTIKGFKSVRVIEREKNLGLAENIVNGVTKLSSTMGKS